VFAHELLTASGSNFRDPPVNFSRALQNRTPEGIAQVVALNFMGVRAEQWPTQQLAAMAACFAQVGYKSTAEWKEEIVFNDPASTNAARYIPPSRQVSLPGGETVTLPANEDPRRVFADWLVSTHNPWFARNLANRSWAWLLGRGIIEEPDDIRPDNPPSNAELLTCLESELIGSQYDLKHLFRVILNSQTYQLASVPRSVAPEAAAHFASYPLRRLDAEVLIDAIDQVTGSTESYSSAIPEPFTFIPEGTRSIALPDGSITSSFLEMFGRPSRDTGLESERNNLMTPAQRLHLLNSSSIQRKIAQSRLVQTQSASRKPPREIAMAMYLQILSRYPTEAELQTVEAYAASSKGSRRDAVTDLAWALMNNPEFLYRH